MQQESKNAIAIAEESTTSKSSDLLHPHIIRKIKSYWQSERSAWSRAGFEFDDLCQSVRVKLLEVPEEILAGKGIGYRVRIAENFLKDQLKKLRSQKQSQEVQLLDLLNERSQGKDESGESGLYNVHADETVDLSIVENQAQYLTTSQKLAGTGYRIRRIRKPVHLKVMYDILHPRRYHRCLVLGRWLILDIMTNQEDCVYRHEDIEAIRDRLRARKEIGKLPLPLTMNGNKNDVTDYPIPGRLTDKDRRIRREDPIAKRQDQHRKDFFSDFF